MTEGTQSLAAHLVWSGAAITISAQAAYVAVVILGPPGSAAVVVPALLAIAGPLTAITGLFIGRGFNNADRPKEADKQNGPRPT